PPRAHLAAALSHFPRRARVGPPPLLGGYASHRLAHPARDRVRHGHRRGRGRRGGAAPRAVHDRAHWLASPVPHHPHPRRARRVYLGGNGFYWRIATSPALPGVLEVRRAETGIRAWEARVGEYYHALDGAYGGLWRRNGRPPQQLVSVGFSAQGLFEGSYYRRRLGAAGPRAAWILEGVKDEVIGDFGLSGGGAAGFELDRADAALGTPPSAIVIASSEGHGPSFVVVFEELLSHLASATGERP